MKKTVGSKLGLILVCSLLLVAFGLYHGQVIGATLLSDDFEDGNSTGWSTSGGTWSVVNDGTYVYKQSKSMGKYGVGQNQEAMVELWRLPKGIPASDWYDFTIRIFNIYQELF
jgi:hypothetical protein